MSNNQKGFTLIELLIVMIMTSMIVGLITMFTFNYWRYGYSAQADLEILTERLNANDFLRDYIGTSSGVITQNGIPDVNTGLADATAGANYWQAMHAVPSKVNMGASASIAPILYFKKYSQNASKQLIYNGANPYEDEYILYLDGTSKSLKLRTIANPSAPSNRAITSCPASIASASCPADKTLISNIASIDKRFFSKSGALIDWTSVTDIITGLPAGPDNSTIEVVELKLNVSKKPLLQSSNTISSTTVIRIALRNV